MPSPAPTDIARALQAALRHHQQGEFAAAEQGYRRVLEAAPDQPDANHLMGVLLDQTGHGEAGVALIRRALAAAPENPEAHCNLGRVLEGLGRLDEAMASYEAALQRRPDFGQARFNLAATQRKLGRLEVAIETYRTLLRQEPRHVHALFNLGNALKAAGSLKEAIDSYSAALAIEPDLTPARVNLANALHARGDAVGAQQLLVQTVVQTPDNADACMSLALQLRGRELAPEVEGDAGRAALTICLGRDDLEHQDLAVAATALVLAGAPPAVTGGQAEQDGEWRRPRADEPAVAAFLGDPLLRLLLRRTVVMAPSLECFLGALRESLLVASAADGEPGVLARHAHWLLPLAVQCFRNGYLYPETPDESELVATLGDAVDRGLVAGGPVDLRLTLLACYRPLHEFPDAAELAARPGPDGWAELARVQILEPLAERALVAAMPRLDGAERTVSAAVRDQHETHPYPRWTGLYRNRPVPLLECVARNVSSRRLVSAPAIARPRVLVAGCGTGLHAIGCAVEYEGAEVLAVDLSGASLAYGQRRAQELGVANIEFLQADLLDLGRLPRRFDVIESVGVLDHLADPMAGWRVLCGLLEPGGYMKIGLYSERARRAVVAARALVAERGFEPTPAGLRAARAALLELPPDDPARGVVASGDFYTAAGVRDLMFHVQEHRYTLEQIAAMIGELGLEPLGFVVDEALRRAYLRDTPEDPEGVSLAGWARFEAQHPATFGEMYQLWLRPAAA